MIQRRQRPIPVTGSERAFLEQQKTRYEKASGDSGDWGKFLETMVLLGLAAAGVYALAQANKQTQQSANVSCSVCGKDFVMAIPNNSPRVVNVKCPHCQTELVVNIG